jgi:hypothetical protein
VPLPKPEIGLVISYGYLWASEAAIGQEEGLKDRPCMIADIAGDGKFKLVTVFPITHSAPQGLADGVEIPAQTKARLGLDDLRSWIVTTEANEFIWPGPDVRIVSRHRPAYGQLPERLVTKILWLAKENAAVSQRQAVKRDAKPGA